jgi:CheY-like chemotaxis protein
MYGVQVKHVAERMNQLHAKLNVLLTLDRPHASEHWTTQLPRLLEPQGVAAYAVTSVQDAVRVATELPIHAAIVDLGTPLGGTMWGTNISVSVSGVSGVSGGEMAGGGDPSGLWVLELFRRLPHRPPVVVIHNPPRSRREGNWILSQSLRLGAFSVLNKPVQINQLLSVFQRLVDRQYRGIWPGKD